MLDKTFLWGCATAGYQVEARLMNAQLMPVNADWDLFVGNPAIRDRVHTFFKNNPIESLDVNYTTRNEACAHESDTVLNLELDRLKALGVNAYRFSVEWNKVQSIDPSTGAPDPLQASECDRVVATIRAIAARKMRPIITLNHLTLPTWVLVPPAKSQRPPFLDLPTATEDDPFKKNALKGWESPGTITAYVAFVKLIATTVHDRLREEPIMWITLNEPIGSMVGAGYFGGLWCPGFADADRGKNVCLNLVKEQILAFGALKAIDTDHKWQVGFAHAMMHAIPTSSSSVLAAMETGAAAGAAATALAAAAEGAAAGGFAGAALGLALLGPIGLLLGFLAGAIAGALGGLVGGAIAGGVVGAIAGAIAGTGTDLHKDATDQFDYFYNDWMLRALVKGEIDVDLKFGTTRTTAEWDAAWLGLLGNPAIARNSHVDFIGVNYYRRVHVFACVLVALENRYTGGLFFSDGAHLNEPHGILNEMGWEAYPRGMSAVLRRIKRDYDTPILITENGTPEMLDANRAAALVAHIDEIVATSQDAEPPKVLGYVHWSAVDNWEWQEDYSKRSRFGLFTLEDRNNAIRIGFTHTFRRQITDAALAYGDIINDRDTTRARARFGALAPEAERIDLPRVSNGALWTGALQGQVSKLFLDSSVDPDTGAATLWGLIYYSEPNVWVRLDNIQWDPATRQLSFSHFEREAVPEIPSASGVLTMSSAPGPWVRHNLDGIVSNPGATPFSPVRVQAHGCWLPNGGGGSWIAIAMHQLFDGDVVVKRLQQGDGNRWEAFRATGTTLALDGQLGSSTFRFTFQSGDPRELVVTQVSGSASDMPSVTSFRRLRSSLDLLAEP